MIIAALLAVLIGIAAAFTITTMVVVPLQRVVGVAEKIAAGDLTANLPTDRLDEPGQLMRAMQQMTVSLRDLLHNLTSGIAQLATATEEMAAISQQNAAGVSQQKAETEQVATAMNEMAATVQDVAKNAEEASSAATESATEAQRGEQVAQAVHELKVTLENHALPNLETAILNSQMALKKPSFPSIRLKIFRW